MQVNIPGRLLSDINAEIITVYLTISMTNDKTIVAVITFHSIKALEASLRQHSLSFVFQSEHSKKNKIY